MFLIKQKGLINKAIIFLALLALIFSFTSKIEIQSTRIFGVVWNLGHIFAFYLWTYLCITYNRKLQSLTFIQQFFLASFMALLFGGIIELIQFQIGRSAELGDVASDLMGALFALSMHSNKRKDLHQTALRYLKLVLLLAMMLLHKNIIFIPVNEYYVHKQFPTLLNPSTPFEKTRVKKEHSYKIVKSGENENAYFDVHYITTRYSGISVEYFPLDWGEYAYLEIDTFNPENVAYSITCRIHDVVHEDGDEEYSDRFNQRYKLLPGRNVIKVDLDKIKDAPAGREMDLANIKKIGLFATQLEKPKNMYLYGIRLVK